MPSAIPLPVDPRRTAFTASLTKLAGVDMPDTEFNGKWLSLVVARCDAVGGRLRRPAADGTLGVAASHGFEAPDLQKLAQSERYQSLVLQTYASGMVKAIPPDSLDGGMGRDNATCGPVIVAPLLLEGEIRGVVELLLSADAPPDRQREAIGVVREGAAAMAAFERRIRERKLHARQALIDDVERLVRSVHGCLGVRATAYAIANDGRRLIGCDRVTVLVRRGNRYVPTAMSGVEQIETRSRAAKLLARAAAAAAQTNAPVWFGRNDDDIPPQIRAEFERYVDDAHVREVAVLPLSPPAGDEKAKPNARPVAAIVVEQIEGESLGDAGRERARLVAEHGALALTNALQYEAIPLHFLWRALGGLRSLFAPGRRVRTIGGLAIVLAFAGALKFVQADLQVSAKAVLRPTVRHHVFAPLDGTVKQIHVRHGDRIAAGQLLVELRNTDLEVALVDAAGRRTAAEEQLLAVERALFEDGTKLGVEERHRMAGQRGELRQKLASVDEELKLLRHKRSQLQITSPVAGEVTTWNIAEALENRPVRQGQVLIDVADTNAGWELELQVPEDSIGHLLQAQEVAAAPLQVRYRLNSAPEEDRLASVNEIHLAAEVRGEEGNTVLVRAAIDPNAPPPGRAGAEAVALVRCHKRAVGYVWFHDVVDFVRTKVFFQFF